MKTGVYSYMQRNIAPLWLLCFGLVLLPISMIEKPLFIQLVHTVILGYLVYLHGKRLQYLYFIFFMASIVFFELFHPQGRIIYEIMGLPITYDALLIGSNKALRIMSLIFVSLCAVSSNVLSQKQYPLLAIFSDLMRYYGYIIQYKPRNLQGHEKKYIISHIDDFIMHAYEMCMNDNDIVVQNEEKHTTFQGILLMSICCAVLYGTVIIWK